MRLDTFHILIGPLDFSLMTSLFKPFAPIASELSVFFLCIFQSSYIFDISALLVIHVVNMCSRSVASLYSLLINMQFDILKAIHL